VAAPTAVDLGSEGDAQVDFNTFTVDIGLSLNENFDSSISDQQNAAIDAVLAALSIDGATTSDFSVVVDPADVQAITVVFTTSDSASLSTATNALADSSAFNSAVETALQSSVGAGVTVNASTTATITDVGTGDEFDLNAWNNITKDQVVAECLDDDLYVDGYSTGQAIAMDYTNSRLKTVAGETVLELHFLVPARYALQYAEAGFAITFHSRDDNGDQGACFTNKLGGSYNNCASPSSEWSNSQLAENPCFYDYTADFKWSDIFSGLFRTPTSEQNGSSFDVIITADIETWTKYSQGSANGRLDHDSDPNSRDTPRTQGEWSDVYGDNSGIDAGTIYINSERYAFSQIPFILSFQNQVTAEATLQTGSALSVISAVVKQDLVEINMDTAETTTDRNPDQAFARLGVTVRVNVQYPYAIRGVGDDVDTNPPEITVTEGSNLDASRGTDGIEFVGGDRSSKCRDMQPGQTCSQELEFRVFPAGCESASGTFQLEFWVECIVPDDGCGIDDLWQDNATKTTSNSYATLTFSASTGNFCPVVLDEYKIEATLKIYNDDQYTDELSLVTADQADYVREQTERADQGDAAAGALIDVTESYSSAFLNDIVYFRAEYYAYTDKNADSKTKDEIDFVRSTRIYLDAKLPISDMVFRENYDTTTTLKILAQDGDITGDFTSAGDADDTDSDGIDYRVVLCGLDDLQIGADKVQEWGDLETSGLNYRSTDCFTADRQGNAIDLLDFAPSYDETADPTSDYGAIATEKEVRFKLRLDERIFPMKPVQGSMNGQDDPGTLDTSAGGFDQTNIRMTVESEIYYRGNKHPTRRMLSSNRRLQEGRAERMLQNSVSSNPLVLRPPTPRNDPLQTCLIDEARQDATLVLWMSVEDRYIPTAETSGDWETNFVYEISNIYGLIDPMQVQVLSLTTCDGNNTDAACRQITSAARRMEGSRLMRVKFRIHGDSRRSGAFYINRFQELVVDPARPLDTRVSVFANSEVHDMNAVECGRPLEEVDEELAQSALKEESSAARPLAFVAGLAGLALFLL